MPDDTLARPERWARFRFSVIGGLLASPPAGGDLQAALRALAERTYQHPCRPGARVQLGFSTLERWYSAEWSFMQSGLQQLRCPAVFASLDCA